MVLSSRVRSARVNVFSNRPEHRVPEVFDRAGKFGFRADHRRLFAVGSGRPEQSLPRAADWVLGRAVLRCDGPCPQPLQQHGGTLGPQTLHRFQSPWLLLAVALAGIAVEGAATPRQ